MSQPSYVWAIVNWKESEVLGSFVRKYQVEGYLRASTADLEHVEVWRFRWNGDTTKRSAYDFLEGLNP